MANAGAVDLRIGGCVGARRRRRWSLPTQWYLGQASQNGLPEQLLSCGMLEYSQLKGSIHHAESVFPLRLAGTHGRLACKFLSTSRSKICNSNSRNTFTWMPQSYFRSSGVATRSLCSTRICTCRPSPVVAADRSSSSNSAMTLRSDPSAPMEAGATHSAGTARRYSSSSKSSCSSSISSSSRGSSNSSMWEGDRDQLPASYDNEKKGEGAEMLELDDPLLRLQSLRLQHQPRSPLLLLRRCSPQDTGMLQRIGGDTCPIAAELPPAAEDAISEQAASCGPLQIPASGMPAFFYSTEPERRRCIGI